MNRRSSKNERHCAKGVQMRLNYILSNHYQKL
jgi:hypothetical protein